MGADQQISVGCVVAAALWVVTVLFILGGTVTALSSPGSDVGIAVALALMTHGLACSAAAATYTIRNMFRAQNRLLREAFRLGREQAADNVQRFKGQ